jgi:hypothetical protein
MALAMPQLSPYTWVIKMDEKVENSTSIGMLMYLSIESVISLRTQKMLMKIIGHTWMKNEIIHNITAAIR